MDELKAEVTKTNALLKTIVEMLSNFEGITETFSRAMVDDRGRIYVKVEQ